MNNLIKKINKEGYRFVIASGIGCLFDFTIYSLIICNINIEPFYSNTISSLIASTGVYIFTSLYNNNYNAKGIALYFIYTIINIIVFSYFINIIIINSVNTYNNHNVASIMAKIIVTPVSLLCNFITSKFLIAKYK